MPSNLGHALFVICQNGAEAALKSEVSHAHPELRFAFSRPGFVTFKVSEGEPLKANFAPKLVLARAFGLSVSKAKAAGVAEALKPLIAEFKPTRIHAFERDYHEPGTAPKDHDPFRSPIAMTAQLREAYPSLKGIEDAPLDGEVILDLIRVEEDEWWIGVHQHTPAHPWFPGGRPPIQLPLDAPSRAYLKLEEAILLFSIPMRSGDVAVEIGSAPGGASHALIERGLSVTGVDPSAMDPAFLERAGDRFKWIKESVTFVARDRLPKQVQWLLLDMHVEPEVAIVPVDRLVPELAPDLLGVVLTIKLNQWKLVEKIPAMLEYLRSIGLTRIRARQLCSNKQEFCVYGLTRKGSLR